MLLCELFDTTGLKFSSFEDFMNSLRWIPREQLKSLQLELDQINQEMKKPLNGLTKLYHGTPNKIAEIIKKEGFQLTSGQRQGFMGAINHVANKGIFLTDSKKISRILWIKSF